MVEEMGDKIYAAFATKTVVQTYLVAKCPEGGRGWVFDQALPLARGEPTKSSMARHAIAMIASRIFACD